jgi:hypothetical protein
VNLFRELERLTEVPDPGAFISQVVNPSSEIDAKNRLANWPWLPAVPVEPPQVVEIPGSAAIAGSQSRPSSSTHAAKGRVETRPW